MLIVLNVLKVIVGYVLVSASALTAMVGVVVAVLFVFSTPLHADQFVCVGENPKVCMNTTNPAESPDVYAGE